MRTEPEYETAGKLMAHHESLAAGLVRVAAGILKDVLAGGLRAGPKGLDIGMIRAEPENT